MTNISTLIELTLPWRERDNKKGKYTICQVSINGVEGNKIEKGERSLMMVKESTDRVICEQKPEMGKKLARAICLRQKHTDLKKRLMWLEWVEQKGR